MKGKVLKRTLAAVMSLVIVGGAMPLTESGLLPFTPLTASALVIEDDHISYDMSTGKLTLKGIFNKEIWNDYKNNELKNVVIRSVYAEEGMVLPSDCSSMFYQFEYLESVDLHNADARTVKDMSKMFWKCGALKTLDMSNLDTSRVTNMERMFFECFKLNSLNISGFDTGNVTNMELMFCSCKSLTTLDLSGFDTSNVTNMVSMFNSCSALESLNISSFDTSNVTDMNSMFCYSSKLNLLDLSSFDTQNVTSMKYMFEKCSSLTTIYVSNGWKTPSNQPDIFSACTSLVGGQGTVFDGNNTGSSYAHIDGGTSNPGYFTYKKGFESLPFDETTGTLTLTGKIKKAQLDEYRNDTRVKNITADATAVLSQNCAGLFDGFSAECIDLSNVDTTNVTDMSQMFFNCSSLKAIFVSDKWVTAPSTSRMFLGCDSLVGGNGTKYYSTQTNGTYACIDGKDGKNGYFSMHCCTLNDFGILWLRGNINRYDLDNYRGSGKGVTSIIVTGRSALLPTDCSGLFKDFPDVEYIGLLGTDPNCNATQYVTNMSEMCSGCSNLTEFDMSYCDTSKVTDMSDMFCGCKALTTLDFSEINTSALKDTSGMFSGCKQLKELDLSSFDTRNVTNMVTMFSGCSALKTITVGELWSLESERNSVNMFKGCSCLVGCAGTEYNRNNSNNSIYAHIDTPETAGYLSVKPTEFELKHNCEFNNNIAMCYAFPKADLTGCDNIRLLVYKEEYETGAASPTTKKKILKNYSATTINSVDYIMFSFAGITATDMNCRLSATLFYDKNGSTHCSQLDEFSIKEYAHNRLEKSSSAKFKKMIVDMLNYGAAAQTYFNKNANDLTNKDLTDAQRKLGTQTMPTLKTCEKTNALSGAKVTFNGKNLIFDNNIILVFRMKFPTSYTMKNVKLKLSYKTSKGVSVTKEIPYSKFQQSGEYYTANFNTLAITDFRSPISVKVYDGTKQISSELIYSVETYVYNRLNASPDENYKVLIKELMKYGISAEQNFS